jgi:hypothetical protein
MAKRRLSALRLNGTICPPLLPPKRAAALAAKRLTTRPRRTAP